MHHNGTILTFVPLEEPQLPRRTKLFVNEWSNRSRLDPGFKSPRTNLATQFRVGVIQNLQDLLLPSRSHNRSQGGPEGPRQVVKRLRIVNGRTFSLGGDLLHPHWNALPGGSSPIYRVLPTSARWVSAPPTFPNYARLEDAWNVCLLKSKRKNDAGRLWDQKAAKWHERTEIKGVRSRRVKKHTQHDTVNMLAVLPRAQRLPTELGSKIGRVSWVYVTIQGS